MSEAIAPGGEAAPADVTHTPSGEGEHTPAPAETTADAATADVDSDIVDEALETEAQKKRRGGFQRRIDELVAEKRAAERREQLLWEQLRAREQSVPASTPAAPAAPAALPHDLAAAVGPAPRPEDFPAGEFDPAYIKASVRHDLKIEQAQAVMQQRQAQARTAEQTAQQKLSEAMQSASAKYADFAEVALNPNVPITHAVARELAELDAPADVAYWLGKNPREAERIAALRDPRAVARELARIEVRVTSAPPPPKPTSAPPPPAQTARGGAASVRVYDPAKMTAEEYYKARMAGHLP